ncbi:MAG: 3'-5' exonuclease [Bacteroidales bacterium]|nr:3'-5' exonuclease [Bacteroidales bacterium]
MELKLKKPIAFFDLEATGINVSSDRIIEICVLKINPDHTEETFVSRVNPQMPISKEAIEITGIKDEDLKDCPTFAEIAPRLNKFLENCDFGGFNSNKFDIPMLAEEFLRANIDFDMRKRHSVDVQVIYHKLEQRNLTAAYKFYCNKDLTEAHTAMADTKATYEVLKAQLDKYPNDIENDIEKLATFSNQTNCVDFAGRIIYNEKGEEIINFGKYKGVKVEDVFKKEPGYYAWVMNGDFPLYTKKVLTALKLRGAAFNK